MKTIRTITEDAFNAAQPCASDMHNGCDKCEPAYDFVEVPAKLVRDIIKDVDLMFSDGSGDDPHGVGVHIGNLESLLKEQSK